MHMDSSPLLRLPAELRNRIYELVLVSPEPATIAGRKNYFSSSPQILRTCRQINNEATAILYSDNVAICRVDDISASLDHGRFFMDGIYDDYNVAWTKDSFDVDQSLSELIRRFRRYRIVIDHVWKGVQAHDRRTLQDIRRSLRAFCKYLGTGPALSSIEISFDFSRVSAGAGSHSPEEFQWVLEPLRMLRAVDTVTFDENVTPEYAHQLERDMKDSPLLDIAKEYEILEQHVEDIRRVSAYLTTGVWYQGRHMSESLSGIWPFYQPPDDKVLWEAKQADRSRRSSMLQPSQTAVA